MIRGTVNSNQRVWDVNTMSFIDWDGSLRTGSLTIGKVEQGAGGTSPWLVTDKTYTVAIENDVDGNPIYIGLAPQGSAKSAAAWQIRKLTFASGNPTDIQFAGGTSAFTSIWDNRSGLSYS